MFDFLKLLLAALAGWFCCMLWHGLIYSPAKVAEVAQSAVNAAVESSAKIQRSEAITTAAKDRVRIVRQTVTVDATCPPGRGAVSDDVAERMRDALETRSATGAVRVRD